MHLRVSHALQQRPRLEEEGRDGHARQILPGHELLDCGAGRGARTMQVVACNPCGDDPFVARDPTLRHALVSLGATHTDGIYQLRARPARSPIAIKTDGWSGCEVEVREHGGAVCNRYVDWATSEWRATCYYDDLCRRRCGRRGGRIWGRGKRATSRHERPRMPPPRRRRCVTAGARDTATLSRRTYLVAVGASAECVGRIGHRELEQLRGQRIRHDLSVV